jgi:pimeloyl-ACP methyl ester carboxylesterase
MLSMLSAVCALLVLPTPPVASRFEQVAPAQTSEQLSRSKDQQRAVVLIHGFVPSFSSDGARQVRLRDWQRPGSLLVKRLAREADVFVFGYGQNVSLDVIVRDSALKADIARLRKLGYRELVLVGHSAGGLVARHFVEDNPDAGVTRVIQVCAPNGGTPAASLWMPPGQRAFLECLTEKGRMTCLKARAGKRIPRNVDFVCLLTHVGDTYENDGLVPCACQWSADLRKQCIPVTAIEIGHRQAVRKAEGVEAIARLVRERQPRWEPVRVKRVCQELLGK